MSARRLIYIEVSACFGLHFEQNIERDIFFSTLSVDSGALDCYGFFKVVFNVLFDELYVGQEFSE